MVAWNGVKPLREAFRWRKRKLFSWRRVKTIAGNAARKSTAKALSSNNRLWTFQIREGPGEHQNHPPSTAPTVKKFTDEQKAFVAAYLERPSVPNREVAVACQPQSRFPMVVTLGCASYSRILP